MRDQEEPVRPLLADVALGANGEGYALLETFEVPSDRRESVGTYTSIRALALRMDVMALLTSGAVDRDQVERIARDVRLVVRR